MGIYKVAQALGESNRAEIKTRNYNIRESVWFYAWEVDNGSDLFIKEIMERYRDKKKVHMIFVDLEKTYDKVPRYLIWWPLERKESLKDILK